MQTLLLKFDWRKTLFFSIAVFAVLLAAGEYTLRQPAIQARIPAPQFGGGYTVFGSYVVWLDAYVHEHGTPDCIFLGNSMVRTAINPQVFADAYAARAESRPTCFNFGLSALTASTAAPIAEFLVEKYHPGLLIVGTAAWEYNALREVNPLEATFIDTPWMRQREGHFNPGGWMTDHYAVYRYLNAIPDYLKNGYIRDRSPHVDGFQPAVEFGQYVPVRDPNFDSTDLMAKLPGYTPSEADMDGIRRIAALDRNTSTRILILEMPNFESALAYQHPGSSYHDEWQAFTQMLGSLRAEYEVPVWTTTERELFDPAGYADQRHLYVTAAMRFSAWLGAQVGQAVSAGLMRGDLSAELLSAPPLDIPLPDAPPEPMVSVTPDLNLPANARIFNPASGLYARDLLISSLREYLFWQYETDTTRAHLASLLEVLQQMQYEDDLPASDALAAWRESKSPQALRDAGFTYVLVSGTWLSWLSADESAILNNPANYEKITDWEHFPLDEQFYLFRAISGEP